jgi:DNA modification methylase
MSKTAMKIEMVDIEALIPYARNARTHSEQQVTQIAASIREFGFNNPVLIDGQTTIIAGHGRVLGAKKLGLDRVPCIRLTHMTDAQRRAYILADNRIALNSGWDDAMLALELQGLETDGLDLGLMGFDEAELQKLLQGMDLPAEQINEDEIPEVPVDPVTKPGDLWTLGKHRLLCGDSTKAEDVARLMAGAKADLCFTSPPYNLGSSVSLRNGARKSMQSAYNEDNDNDARGWVGLMRGFMAIAIRSCSVVAINVQMLAGNKIAFLSLFGEYAEHTIDIAVWCKTNAQPAMADRVMTSAFEFVWLLSPDKKPTRAISTASFPRGTFSNVFESGTASGHDASVHGAVFPLAVASHFINGMSQPAGAVYEPFCGSGTTLIAAEQLGRKCYGMEISPQYCDVIVKRWETLTGSTATRESTP